MDYKLQYDTWLTNPKMTKEGALELSAIKDNEKEIEYRFGKELEFGTAGMRGIIGMGTNMMNVYTVQRATQGLSEYIKNLGKKAKSRGVVISYDTRRFSREFALASAGVLTANGIKTYIYEEGRPVPMLSFAVRELKCVAGIMITASHNPKEYNGYKVYGEDGAQMSPEATKIVVDYISKVTDYFSVSCNEYPDIFSAQLKGVKVLSASFEKKYYKEILKLGLSGKAVKQEGKSIKLVYTPVHGTGYVPVTTVLKKMNINVTVVEEQVKPDTEFSTVAVPNPEFKETLTLGIKLADKIKADVVFGTDPDCDRLGVALRDDNGEFFALSGNQVGVLLLDYVLKRLVAENKLDSDCFAVKSFVSTGLAKSVADSYNVELKEVPVGFKFIGEKIKQAEESKRGTFVFGFEESCGYLRGTHARDKDAVVASMLFAEMVCYYKSVGTSIFNVLNGIYDAFGYCIDSTVSIQYSGLRAMDEMNEAVNKMAEKTITKVGINNVTAVRNYKTGKRICSDGTVTQLEYDNINCLYYEFENGGFICLRPSGTEPKLKIYYSMTAKDKVMAQNLLEETKEAFNKILNN